MNQAVSVNAPAASSGDPEARIFQIRDTFLDTLIRWITLLGLIALPLVLWRASYSGWISAYTSLFVFVGLAVVLFFLRKRLSFRVRGAVTLTLFFFLGFNGIPDHGLYAPSVLTFILLIFIAAMLFSKGVVVSVMALSAAGMIAMAYGFISGYLKLGVNLNANVLLPGPWASTIILLVGESLAIGLATVTFIQSAFSLAKENAIQHDQIQRLIESQKLEAVGRLTGGVAHDFNNQLGIVVGNLDLIEERLTQGDVGLQRQIDVARDAALRCVEVTRSLLAVAQRQPLEVQSVDINSLLQEMMPLIHSSAGSLVTTNMTRAPEGLIVRVDALGLTSAILNLVINACEAMQSRPGDHRLNLCTRSEHVAPGTYPELAAGDYAVLEVSDNGPGMSAATRSRAFEPFFTTKAVGQGTGLGLSTARGFTMQVGGTTRINDNPDEGTTVLLYFPLQTAAEL